MLNPYQFLDAKDIYKIHEFVEHTVLQVWCNPNRRFTKNLLHEDFREIIATGINHQYLLDPIKKIYGYCKRLNAAQLQLLRSAFINNNDIEELCEGRGNPVLYNDLRVGLGKDITNQLYIFCTGLYKHVLGLEPFYSVFGRQEDHFRDFSILNKLSVCPFCGINGMLNQHSYPKREAYDHFLPKETYPFTAVNFNNLAPACHHCNSSFKSRKDPLNLREGGPRRSVFYPFRPNNYTIEITIAIEDQDNLENLSPAEVTVNLECDAYPQEKITWDNIYSVSERYKNECCTFGFGWANDAYTAVTVNEEVISYNAYIGMIGRSNEPRSKIKTAFLEGLVF